MAAGFQAGTTGLQGGGASATSVVTANARVKTANGFIGIVSDIVQFPGTPIIGNWMVPAMRCSIQSVPAINQTSQGLAYSPSPSGLTPAGPMQVTSPDAHASGM